MFSLDDKKINVLEYNDEVVGYKDDLVAYERLELARLLQDDNIDLETIRDLVNMLIDLQQNAESGRLLSMYNNPMCGADWKYAYIVDDEE